jgi:hypothetical protein
LVQLPFWEPTSAVAEMKIIIKEYKMSLE